MTAPLSQRRNLAILFSDLCESTRISGGLEPEQFAALLDRLRLLYDEVLTRHGGMIVRIDGDGVTCAFGHPQPVDDAGRRATEAALDLHAAAAALDAEFGELGAGVRLHSGVHAGVVLVREGDLVRGRIEILGDATNLAARLCDHAEAGQIVVSEASLGGDRYFFAVADELAVPVRGRKALVRALLVTGREGLETRFDARARGGLTPFCGRREELAGLERALAAARDGQVARALVVGPPGIGKTRLVSEFLDAARRHGAAVCRGYCEAYLGARPLQPFEQIARDVTPGEGGDLSARLLRWARDSAAVPTVLVIDDWQWADDASHRLLAELVAARGRNLMVLLASRPEGASEPGDGESLRIDLGPLPEAEAGSAIGRLLGAADPVTVARIRELSGGSPLFIEELCHASALGLPGQPGEASAWLDAMVEARFRSLPARQAELVRTASVIGATIPARLFAALTGVEPGDPVLAALADSDFLYEGDIAATLRFKHALTRDAVYRTVALDERQRLHALVAGQLEAMAASENEVEGDHVDALAYHWAACGDDARALRYAIAAGDRALALAALDRAQAHFRQGLALVCKGGGDGSLLAALIVRYGRAAVVDPSREQLPVLQAALAHARGLGDGEAVLMAEYWLGSIAYGLGEADLSLGHLETAQRLLPEGERPGFETQLLGNLGQSHAIASNFTRARAFLDQSIERRQAARRAMPGRGGDPTGHAYILTSRAYLDGVQGHMASAHAGFEAAMAALGGAFHPIESSVQALRALTCLMEHDLAGCQRLIAAALEASTRARARYLAVSCRAVQDYADWLVSRDPARVDALEARVRWLIGADSKQRLSNNLGWLVEVLAAEGRADQALTYAEAAFRRADEGDRLGEGPACRALARLAARGQAPLPARHYLDRAYASATLREAPRETCETMLAEADVLRLTGDGAGAEALQARAVAGFRALGMERRILSLRSAAAASP